jgi:hypothetical protein
MGAPVSTAGDDLPSGTLVWIDAREAVIARIQGDQVQIERVESEVPAHHRATGHVRHDPAVRHGGGGPQSAGESHRTEHLGLFLGDIANRLSAGDALLILGPGMVHERLARQIAESDGGHGRIRDIFCEASPPMTARQLRARLRRFAGVEPRRHTVGAYRWVEPRTHNSKRAPVPLPRRVDKNPPRDRGPVALGE